MREDWPRVYRVLVRGAERWLVDARSAKVPGGRRTYHGDEAEALAVAKQLERIRSNEGSRAFFDLSAQERSEAAEALAILAEDPEATLVCAARYYVGYLAERDRHKTAPFISAALDEYLAMKTAQVERDELSKLSLFDVRSKSQHVRRGLSELRVSELTPERVKGFLDNLPLAPLGRQNVRVMLSQFLTFCVGRKWLDANPATGIKIKVPKHEPEALSLDQAERLLRVAEEQAPLAVPYLCVSLFAGLRPGEARALDWGQIHLATGQIEVLPETSKVGERRFVEIVPNLTEWLVAYRQASGPIIGEVRFRFESALAQVLRSSGFKAGAWPKDVLRHSYGTYWLAIHKNRAALAELMGNSPKIIGQHYRRAIPPHVAQKYWQIVPTIVAQIVPFPQSTAQT